MDLSQIIIDTPYEARGCYDCWYHITINNRLCCELHKVQVSDYKWCEGWESDERHCIRIKERY